MHLFRQVPTRPIVLQLFCTMNNKHHNSNTTCWVSVQTCSWHADWLKQESILSWRHLNINIGRSRPLHLYSRFKISQFGTHSTHRFIPIPAFTFHSPQLIKKRPSILIIIRNFLLENDATMLVTHPLTTNPTSPPTQHTSYQPDIPTNDKFWIHHLK